MNTKFRHIPAAEKSLIGIANNLMLLETSPQTLNFALKIIEMNRSLKIVLLGLALVLFIGSFLLKVLAPTLPESADYILKGLAIAILLFAAIKQRVRKKPSNPA